MTLPRRWPAAETYLAALDADARRTLLGILTSPSEIRAAAIGRLHVRDHGAELAELLIRRPVPAGSAGAAPGTAEPRESVQSLGRIDQ
jgi:hypothetical protein